MSVGDTINFFIMRNNKLPVLCDMDVQFYTFRSHLRCQFKRFQRVFRRVSGSTAVTINQLHILFLHFCISGHEHYSLSPGKNKGRGQSPRPGSAKDSNQFPADQ